MATTLVAAGFSALFFAFLGAVLEMLSNGVVQISSLILSSINGVLGISSGKENNLFENIVALIPFPDSINLASIIKGIAFALISLAFLASLINSMVSPLTGEESENPAQVFIRCAVTFLLIFLIFGFDFGNSSSIRFDGLLGVLGKWFGLILSKISSWNDVTNLNANWSYIGISPAEYLVGLVFLGTLLTGVLGAAISIVERIVSFAVYIVVGPIAVACYANKEISKTFTTWCMGIFSQFVGILLSMVLWAAFNRQLEILYKEELFSHLFDFVVALAILSLVKNSEKILNNLGIRTMPSADTARSIAGGAAAAFGVFSTVSGAVSKGITTYSRDNQAAVAAGITNRGNLYDSAGNLSDKYDVYGVSKNGGTVSAEQINKEYGFNNFSSPYTATSNGIKATCGNSSGIVSNIERTKNGITREYQNAYLPTEGANERLTVGTPVTMEDGSERYITGQSFNIDEAGHTFYETSSTMPNDGDGSSDWNININYSNPADDEKPVSVEFGSENRNLQDIGNE